MSLYGVGLTCEVNRIILSIRQKMADKLNFSLSNLRKHFKKYDRNQNQTLEQDEFIDALQSFGFFFKIVDYQALFKHFDIDNSGGVSFSEFLNGIRQPLSNRRFMLVVKAWNHLTQGAEEIAIKDLIQNYHLRTGSNLTQEQQQETFLQEIDKSIESNITKQEFIQFYEDISLSITSEESFIQQFQHFWGVREDDHASVSKEEVKEITKLIRHKLIQQSNGTHDEFLLRKLFTKFDFNKSGYLTLDELKAMLLSLNMNIEQKFLVSIFQQFDKNNSSAIEFEEFLSFISYNPY